MRKIIIGVFIFSMMVIGGLAFYAIYRSYQASSNLTQGSVSSITSWHNGTNNVTRVIVIGAADGWDCDRTIMQELIPKDIQVQDQVKIITLPTGDLILEKIPDLRGDPK